MKKNKCLYCGSQNNLNVGSTSKPFLEWVCRGCINKYTGEILNICDLCELPNKELIKHDGLNICELCEKDLKFRQ